MMAPTFSNTNQMSATPPLDTETILVRDDTDEPGPWRAAATLVVDVGLPLVAGVLVAVSFMPPPMNFAAWIALVPFAAAMSRPKGSLELYLGAYLGGVIFSLHGLDYMRTRLIGSGLFESNVADWIANGCLWAFVWPVALYVGRRIARGGRIPMVIVLPMVWVSSEFVRQELGWLVSWSPFPWLQIGVTQAPHLSLIQVADLAGVWGITATIAAVNGSICDAIANRSIKPLVIGLTILSSVWLYGEFRRHEARLRPGPRVALMPHSVRPTSRLQPTPGASILLWSETVPRQRFDASSPQDVTALEQSARSSNSTLIVGCIREHNELRFNSVVVVDPTQGYLGCYDKCFLVPWGEFSPWRWTSPSLQSNDLTPGNAKPIYDVGRYRFGVSICYDICFSRLFRGFPTKPDFFVTCSRETLDPTGFVQRTLLDMTRLRAVENRRSFVRNVEGGFSGVVSSTGDFTPAATQGYRDVVVTRPIPIDKRTTWTSIMGDWLPIACCVCVTVLLVHSRRRR